MVLGKHGIQTFEVVVVMLLFILLSYDILVSTSAHFLSFYNRVICPNILRCQLNVGGSNLTKTALKLHMTYFYYSESLHSRWMSWHSLFKAQAFSYHP